MLRKKLFKSLVVLVFAAWLLLGIFVCVKEEPALVTYIGAIVMYIGVIVILGVAFWFLEWGLVKHDRRRNKKARDSPSERDA